MVATHDLGIIEALNRRTIVLDRGKIIGDFEKPRGNQVGGKVIVGLR
jgi:ABC-type ATPase involved in cell division